MIENLREWVPYNVLIGEPDNPDTHLVEIIEEWKDVVGYEDFYKISSFGRFQSKDRCVNYNRGFRILKGKLLKVSLRKKSGYCAIMPCVDYVCQNIYVHRAVGMAFIPNPENKSDVNHKDGIKSNNLLYNLEWNTVHENRLHAFRTGLQKPTPYNGHCNGEKHYKAKLTDNQVLEIRGLHKKITQREIAKLYNIHFKQVSAIINRKIWKHI